MYNFENSQEVNFELVNSNKFPVSYLIVQNGYLNYKGEVYDQNGVFIDFPRELGKKHRSNLDLSSVTKKFKHQTIVCVVHERHNYSYFHWTYETLPKLIFLSSRNKQIKFDKIYFPYSFWGRSYQSQAIRQLGFNFWELLDSRKNPLLMAKEIVVVKLNEVRRNPSLELCQMIKSTFINKSVLQSPYKNIYLTREQLKSHQGRKIVNEHDLRELLKNYGFQVIIPDHLSLVEQYKIFNESKCIISPHGAALANIVFCERGTKIIELFHKIDGAKLHPTYSNIAKTCGFDLIPLNPKEIAENSENPHRANFVLDLDSLESILSDWSL
jgi:capsular polysaccharide biosynthesis protein